MVLATAMTSAAKRGRSVHVVFDVQMNRQSTGSTSYVYTWDEIFSDAKDQITAYCHNTLGSGKVRSTGYGPAVPADSAHPPHFKVFCDCAHGNTEFPVELEQAYWLHDGGLWTATGTKGEEC